jgi:hypothetical protein
MVCLYRLYERLNYQASQLLLKLMVVVLRAHESTMSDGFKKSTNLLIMVGIIPLSFYTIVKYSIREIVV